VSEVTTTTGLQKGTNWWGAFVIGLAGTILVTGLAPFAVQALGAAAIPLMFFVAAVGVLLCFCLAELAAMMPDRTGGLPSYAEQCFKPLGKTASRHIGGLSGWAYWLGWFPVAPINMILAAAYIQSLFGLPKGRSFLPFGSVGSPVSLAVIVIAVVGMLALFVPSYLGIRLGAGFATLLGIISMVPLTLIVVLPFFKPSSMHWHNVSGFHFVKGTSGSFTLVIAWIFIMSWSALAMEAAACYIGECHNPSRDAKIAMTAEGLYGLFMFTMIPVMFVVVLGASLKDSDPLNEFTHFGVAIFGSGSWVQWAIGLPLIAALMLSALNAIMGVGRSLYQIAEDGNMPRWFGHLNRHHVPDNAMGFNVVCSIIVVFFGSPLRIYIFSNMGYLLSCAGALGGYFFMAHFHPELARPVRMPKFMKWVALAMFIFFMFVWGFGGWNAPKYVVASTEGRTLFYVGLIVVAAYAPLYYWRVWRDRAAGTAGGKGPVVDLRDTPTPAVAAAAADSTPADLGAP
jgi:amino acid transporter